MSLNLLDFVNMLLLSLIMIMTVHAWVGLIYAALFEVVFVILAAILLPKAAAFMELTVLIVVVMTLTISGVECALFFILFIVYYHATNYTNPASLRPKTLKFYYQEFKKTHAYTSMFGDQ